MKMSFLLNNKNLAVCKWNFFLRSQMQVQKSYFKRKCISRNIIKSRKHHLWNKDVFNTNNVTSALKSRSRSTLSRNEQKIMESLLLLTENVHFQRRLFHAVPNQLVRRSANEVFAVVLPRRREQQRWSGYVAIWRCLWIIKIGSVKKKYQQCSRNLMLK